MKYKIHVWDGHTWVECTEEFETPDTALTHLHTVYGQELISVVEWRITDGAGRIVLTHLPL